MPKTSLESRQNGSSPSMIAVGFFLFGLMSGFSVSNISSESKAVQHSNIIQGDVSMLNDLLKLKQQLSESTINMKALQTLLRRQSSESTSASASATSLTPIKVDDDTGSSSETIQKLLQQLAEAKAEAQEHAATHAASDAAALDASAVTVSSSGSSGSSLSNTHSTIDVVNNFLTFAAPLVVREVGTVDDNGMLKAILSSKIKRFSMDVGFNKGRVTVDDWLSKQPDLFVVAVEAIPALQILFETMMAAEMQIGDRTHSIPNTKIPYWKLTQFHASQRALKYKKYCHEESRCMMINGAASTTPGVAEFNTGAGRQEKGGATDTGSLFSFKDAKARARAKDWASTLVRKFRIDDLLKHVPQPSSDLVWDTFKVDIQGADVDAMVSAGKYLKYFTCVIGEFDVGSYQIPKGVATDPSPVLQAAGFVKYNSRRMVWINPKNKEQFLASPSSFGCHRVHDVQVDLNGLISAFKKL